MKLATVGVGGAGGRLADRFLEAERRLGRVCCGQNVLVFDTAQPALDALETVPEDRRALLGDTYPGVEVTGAGADGDAELAVDAAREQRSELRRAVDALEILDADAVVVLAGLGGGTGTGAGAVLLEELRGIYEKPVYAVGILPTEDASADRALNAARGLQSYVNIATNVLLFDNGSWIPRTDSDDGDDERASGGRATASRDGALSAEAYRRMNDALATRLVSLFGAGRFESSTVPESAVDTSDAMRTLATGGVSSIGYASVDLGSDGEGLLAWLRSLFGHGTDDAEDESATDAARINGLVRGALRSRLTLPCEVSSAERAMLVVSGPPETLSRRGFERAVYWLEEETQAAEVLAGDDPGTDLSTLSATVLLSNTTEVPRIETLQERALRGEGRAGGGASDRTAKSEPSNILD